MSTTIEARISGYAGICAGCQEPVYGEYVASLAFNEQGRRDIFHLLCKEGGGPCFGPLDNEPPLLTD